MTTEQKIICAKVGLLELAKQHLVSPHTGRPDRTAAAAERASLAGRSGRQSPYWTIPSS